MKSGSFIRAAVIGQPVAHSLSPAIHNYWIGHHGLQGVYEAIAVAPEDLSARFAALLGDGYAGFNVTLPHKQAVMALCGHVDETARAIGAVNTVAAGPDGTVSGTNTDWTGFTDSILEQIPDFDFAAAPALVLGAGGAARAVIYGLRQKGAADIRVANRTRARADGLARDFGVTAVDWDRREEAAGAAGLLVNTTSSGMKGKESLSFDVACLARDALVCDIIYNPLRTDLLMAADERGLRTVGGLGMLLHQARPAFARWFGVLPEVTAELRAMLEERIS